MNPGASTDVETGVGKIYLLPGCSLGRVGAGSGEPGALSRGRSDGSKGDRSSRLSREQEREPHYYAHCNTPLENR